MSALRQSILLEPFAAEQPRRTQASERFQFRARATMVFADAEGQWLIVHEHFSPFVANS